MHPAVENVAVVGVPDERLTEVVVAFVVARGGEGPSQDELRSWCGERIASYKVPRTIELRADPLPKSGPGKVLKRELREPYWRDRDARIG